MHRSTSSNRVGADEYYMHASPKATPGLRMSSSLEENELLSYNQPFQMDKKEKSRIKFTENAVHVIPFVLLACGFILWFFANPDIVDVGVKPESIAARIEGLTIEGDIDTDSDGTQTGFLPIDVGDLDAAKQIKDQKSSRKLVNRS